MTQEEKQLLVKDLCARLPYRVMIKSVGENKIIGLWDLKDVDNLPLPYLRPMSSMTEEEIEFMGENGFRVYKKTNCFDNNCDVSDDGWDNFYVDKQSFEGVIELFYSHHLDYHGLIPMGLALEAKEGMYKIK